MTTRWSLPGPSDFATRVVEEIDGDGVLFVFLSALLDPFELWSEVARRTPHWTIEMLDVTGATSNPARTIWDHFGWSAPDGTPAPEEIVTDDRLADCVLWLTGVECLDTELRAEWVGFVRELGEARDATERAHGAKPIVVVQGPSSTLDVRSDARVRILHWWGILDRLDVAIYVSQLARGTELDLIDIEQIIEVAAFDLDLAALLIDARCRDTATAAEVCRARAAELSLQGDGTRLTERGRTPKAHDPLWAAGAVDAMGTAVHWHSGILASIAVERLERRIWSAQVKALMPILDVLRIEMIELAAKHGLVVEESALDWEIRDLAAHLRSNAADHRLFPLAEWMRRSRNSLAHLKALSATTRDEGKELVGRARLTGW